ncbi:MAG TPA: CHAT domain-containing protein, partial [Burkholderiales bacterium]
MTQRSFRIRGTARNIEATPRPATDKVTVREARRLVPGRARDGVTAELEVAADEIVRVELENGFVLWSRADDLVREHGQQALSRDGSATWEFAGLAPARMPAARGERGMLGLGIKVLDFFGIDLQERAARNLGTWIEDKQLKGNKPGLYRCPLEGDFALVAMAEGEAIPAGEGPILVFIHGTASSCESSFGKLWAPGNREGMSARERLKTRYSGRVFAFEHRSLSESPIANALALLEHLSVGAEVHLVTHSRGGLVGELMCLGACANLDNVLPPERLKDLFAADRTISEQIGLSPLDKDEAQKRDEAYNADRDKLVRMLDAHKARRIAVQRFVRVACPARGTTLASGRLDRWLSMLNFLAEKVSGDGLFSDGLDFLLAVVKERTDPRTLPGLEAMMPGSALTRLLHHSELITAADLTVIAGDIEGDSLWQKIKLVATDWFYGSDHDLVVNTGSMSGGLRRPEKGARYQQDKGAEVNHFSYFQNMRSVRWLVAGLTRADGEDAGFLPIAAAQKEEPRWRGAVARSRSAALPRPLAVVLPGTLGSHLTVNSEHVWLDYGSLLLGGLKKLRMGAQDVAPGDLIDDFYGPLLEFLARTHRVQIFGYDWRLSVRDAANKLADQLDAWLPQAEREGQPVHLVAHSMGGLVVRSMIADGGRGTALWQRITRLENSRFLMLGTPNLGSYEAVRWLTGFNPTEAKLSLLDITQSTNEIVDLVRQYPGLLELLPFAPENPDFADPARWQTIKDTTRARWNVADRDTLRGARGTWQVLRGAAPDPQTMRYVAGCQPATVVDYQFSDFDDSWIEGRKRLDFIATREGDGTVAWASGILPGVPTWYVEDTAHDALCAQKSAFPGYLDLLMTGTTTRLSTSPPARGRAAANEPARFILPLAPPADGVPGERDVCGFGFGGTRPDAAPDDRPAAPTIEIIIRHGDLSYARHPVLVGHYLGDTIVSAEAALDRQLDNALSRRLDLGIYPGRLGTHALFFNKRPTDKPGGAIVVGLGQVGELTPGLLEGGARAALLDYALQVAGWPDERFGKSGGPRSAAISCLLVGSGAGGMTARDSIESILRGAVAANARLVAAEMDDKVLIDRIEFLELYEDVAIAAAEGMARVLANSEIAAAVHWPAEVVESGQGGHRRVRFDDAPEWWHRLEIIEEQDRPDVLRFIFATDRARAEETLATGQLALAESFIRQASRSADANPEAARTLFEMLLPLRLKESAPRQTDIVLLVDERSARYPWELLENRWSDNGRPPAVNAGLVRQLKTLEFRPRPAHAFKARALVVGNPDLAGWDKFSDLPGARQEAQRVIALLGAHGIQPRDCIDEKADAILENLHRDAWRILHLAGHGEHDYPLVGAPAKPCNNCGQTRPQAERRVSGMVIGKETFLTPGDVEQMRWVPELVFINCCHLGKTGDGRDFDRGALAANLGVQFIRMGVRAVVAAGWAVDDAAALVFAETFYGCMLDGEPFGEAVRAAREEIWKRFPGVNTWGAYQCYGDPSYRLHRDGQQRPDAPRPYHAPGELVADLENLTRKLQVGGREPEQDEKPGTRIANLVDRIPQPQRETWLKRADVCAALGFAWGEARYWPAAIERLEKALGAGKGDCALRVVEQCANFKVRLAAEEWLELRSKAPADLETQRQNRVATIERAILELDILYQRAATEERLNLLGSACKRLALVETDPNRRKEALLNMAAYYYQAFELGTRDKAYPFTNWATARLLALRLDPGLAGDWQTGLEADASRVSEALERSNEKDPNFWDGAALGDVDIVRLLARCAQQAPTATLPADCAARVDAIIDR